MKKRVLSGMRATGKLHLGHLAGVLVNWKRLQNEYEAYFFLADWHGLTDNPENAKYMKENIKNMVLDWLAVGIDPQKATLFIQSLVPQHAELHLVFSMLVSLSRLFRNPTYKEKFAELKTKETYTYTLEMERKLVIDELLKPGEQSFSRQFDKVMESKEFNEKLEEFIRKAKEVLQKLDQILDTEDNLKKQFKSDLLAKWFKKRLQEKFFAEYGGITRNLIRELLIKLLNENIQKNVERIFSDKALDKISYGFLGYPVLQSADILLYKPHYVPVGADQVAHIEITRDIAEKFNRLYGEVFPIPEALLTETPKIPGMDGRKMSKSYGNAIYLSDDEETVTKKVMKYITDPQRIRKSDPGRPEICPVFALHKVFNKEETDEIYKACTTAQIGCVQCKRRLAEKLNETLKPIREKRKELESQNIDVFEVLKEGSRMAQEFASGTMDEVRKAMGMDY